MFSTITYKGKEFTLNDNCNNVAIKCNILDESIMRLARFTDYSPGRWYYCRDLVPLAKGISFNISIDKENPENWRIDVLDEEFLQPYDYQSMIQRELNGEKFQGDFHWKVSEQVEYEMEHLTRLGIIDGWEKGDYI